MNTLLLAFVVAFASGSAAHSQDVQDAAGTASSSGPVSPLAKENVSARYVDRPAGNQTVDPPTDDSSSAQDIGPSLFAENADEDPGIVEIKRIARELESDRALMNQIAGLQRDLIGFAMADPVAAWRSRIPSTVCMYALQKRFCDAMTSSFRKEGGNSQ